ncbi:hypothetical protein, partial [Chryseobacterium sp. CH1]|uniref:hypothetical protein n=1 Tax=Chryseobacterium sp. CH1 TaxID=713551 RepID=UPI001E3B3E1B
SASNLSQRYTLEGRYKGVQGQGISLGAVNVPQGISKSSSKWSTAYRRSRPSICVSGSLYQTKTTSVRQ